MIYKECGELIARNKQALPTPQQLWEHLVKKGVVGQEFPGTKGGDKIKLTADYLNSDEVRDDLIDVVMVLNDGPKIIELPSNMDMVADWNADTPIEDVICQEIKELSDIKKVPPTPQELWERLELKGVAGKEFPVHKGSLEKVALTAEYLNQDKIRENLIDEYMVLADGPQIVIKVTASPQRELTEDAGSSMRLSAL